MKANVLLKAAAVGLLGSLIMFVIMQLGLGAGIAPFEVPPSAAFLISIDMPAKPLALIGHFLYGAFWSIILVALAGKGTNIIKGIGLSVILWLVMMLIVSPLIGWGVFGAGELPQEELYQEGGKLFLESGPKYPIITLLLHLVYGISLGWVNRSWTLKDLSR
jgi:hypothetical protein